MIEQPKTNALDAVRGLLRVVDHAERESSCASPPICSVCGGEGTTPNNSVAEIMES